MHPDHFEIEAVGDAFISLSFLSYTPKEQDFMNRFLNQYATSLNEKEIQTLFTDKPEAVQAIKRLNEFATHYQDEEEIIQEFNEEIHDLLINLNGQNGGLMF